MKNAFSSYHSVKNPKRPDFKQFGAPKATQQTFLGVGISPFTTDKKVEKKSIVDSIFAAVIGKQKQSANKADSEVLSKPEEKQTSDFENLVSESKEKQIPDFGAMFNKPKEKHTLDLEAIFGKPKEKQTPNFGAMFDKPKEKYTADFDSIFDKPKEKHTADFDSIFDKPKEKYTAEKRTSRKAEEIESLDKPTAHKQPENNAKSSQRKLSDEENVKVREKRNETIAKSFFEDMSNELEGENFPKPEELKYVHIYPRAVRRWVLDAVTPKGFYTQDGVWQEGSFFEDLIKAEVRTRQRVPQEAAITEFVEYENVAPDLRGQFRFGIKPDEIATFSPKLKAVFSIQNASPAEVLRFRKAKAVEQFGMAPNDTGSAGSQVAIMTLRVRALTEHLRTHPQDKNSARGLLLLVSQRRRMMKYLKRKDPASYWKVLQTYNLRDMV